MKCKQRVFLLRVWALTRPRAPGRLAQLGRAIALRAEGCGFKSYTGQSRDEGGGMKDESEKSGLRQFHPSSFRPHPCLLRRSLVGQSTGLINRRARVRFPPPRCSSNKASLRIFNAKTQSCQDARKFTGNRRGICFYLFASFVPLRLCVKNFQVSSSKGW